MSDKNYNQIMKTIQSLYACPCEFAYYEQPVDGSAHFETSQARFISASLIKVPILLAWITLERQGAVQPGGNLCTG